MTQIRTRDHSNEPIIHFRVHALQVAPCGAEPGRQWTNEPKYVTCKACRKGRGFPE